MKNDRKWIQGYIPNPTTYLNQDRWEDEIESATQSRRVPSDRSDIMHLAAENGINTDIGLTMDVIRQKIAEQTGMQL